MSTYLENIIDEMVNTKPEPLPPALLKVEKEYKNNLDNAVNNGLNVTDVMKMNLIMAMCLQHGLSIEVLHSQQILFTTLMLESNFSTTDATINRMVNLIQNANN